jgi:undecaprenyl pyrophosphate synthase
VNDELTEKVARAILEDEQKSAEASGCDILLLLHEGHRAAARAAIRVVLEECEEIILPYCDIDEPKEGRLTARDILCAIRKLARKDKP